VSTQKGVKKFKFEVLSRALSFAPHERASEVGCGEERKGAETEGKPHQKASLTGCL